MLSRRVILSAAILAPGLAGAQVDPAREAADKLVAAMGGREAWASAKGIRIAAQHWERQLAAPYDNLILMSLEEPKMRFEGNSATMKRRRAVVGERGWRVSELSSLGPMTAEQVAGDLRWWEAHVYRNLGRLARREPAVTPKLAADGRLELYRPDGVRLMWYRLNAAGQPIAYGQFEDERGSILGPLVERGGGVRLPAWSTSADGGFRATITEAAVLPAAPDVDYDKP
jgi:hypothetical protein